MKNSTKTRKGLVLSILGLALFLVSLAAGSAYSATLSAGNAAGSPGERLSIPLNLSSNPGESVASLNFDLSYDSTQLSLNSATIGQSAQDAGKILSSTELSPGTIRLIIFGLNQTAIADGVLVNLSLNIQAKASAGVVSLTLSKGTASDPGAKPVSLTTLNGSVTIRVADSTPPSGTVSINVGASITNSTSATLTLSATDSESGMGAGSQMQFSNDNLNWSTPEVYAISKSWTLTNGDGPKTVSAKFKDVADNWSEVVSDTIVLDTTSPQTTASPAGGTFRAIQSVTLSVNESATTYYTQDGSIPTKASAVYAQALLIAQSTSLNFFSVDNAGNQEGVKTERYTINLPDTAAPSVPEGLTATAVSSTQIDLSWTASTDDVGVAGYRIYRDNILRGTIDQGGETSYSDTDLQPNTTYTYTVSAYDAAGNQSAQSTAALATSLVAPETTPPVISEVGVSEITQTTALISWSTDEPSTSQVEYGLTIDYGSLTTLDSSPSTQHQAPITNLTVNTTYHFRVRSTDALGNLAVSEDRTLSTLAPLIDTTTLRAGNSSALAGEVVNIPISLSSKLGESVVGLNFDLSYDSTQLSLNSATIGQSAQAADKNLSFAELSPGTIRLIIFGLNQTAMADGVLVNLSLNIQAKASAGLVSLTLSKGIASDPGAKPIALATLNGSVTVSASPGPANKPPVLEPIGDKTAEAGTVLSFNLVAADPEGDVLTYSSENLPQGARLDSSTGQFSWPTAYQDKGIYRNILFTVSDPGGRSDSERITISITTPSLIPQLTATASVSRGVLPLEVSFEVEASDDGQIVKYEWDFDGQGIYDWESTETGKTIYTYSTVGDFTPSIKVTDNDGLTNTYSLSITVLEPPLAPQLKLKAKPLVGQAPLTVSLEAEVSSSVGIAKYEWDFEGDGRYDLLSNSNQLTHTYGIEGLYQLVLKVTDLENVSVTDSLLIRVNSPAEPEPYPLPWIKLKELSQGSDGLYEAIFIKQGQSQGIIRYEWDFDGDALLDLVSTEPEVKQIYRSPGTYSVTLRITAEDGWSGEEGQDIRISDELSRKRPKASAQAQPRTGYAPLTVLFSDSSQGNLISYEWDFEGDGLYELKLTPGEAALVDYLTQGLSHTYTRAGNYLATLRVTDNNGLTDKNTSQIMLKDKPDYQLWLVEPNKDNRQVKGSRLSLVAKSNIPPEQLKALSFEYKTEAQESWQEIPADYRPYHRFTYVSLWDIRSLPADSYQVRTVAKDQEGGVYLSPILTVRIDPDHPEPDISEGLDESSQHYKEMRLEPGKKDEVSLYDGTEAVIPVEAQDEPDSLMIRIIDKNSLAKRLDKEADSYRQFQFKSGRSKFDYYISLSLPYLDQNDDGIVDNSELPEQELKMYGYNSLTNTWEEAVNSQCFPQENYCTAQTNHFSLFGLGSLLTALSPGPGSGGGGGGGCFIATATYGPALSYELLILKQFRDQYLLTNPWGERIVKFYEQHSPPAADFIRDKTVLKGLIRALLKPVVAGAKQLLKTKTKDTPEVRESL